MRLLTASSSNSNLAVFVLRLCLGSKKKCRKKLSTSRRCTLQLSSKLDVGGVLNSEYQGVLALDLGWALDLLRPASDDEGEIIKLEVLFQKIINESYAFHFWHGLTSTLVPHTGSLVEKVLNHDYLRCHDVL
ncbi:hypothetical protein EJ110_NYTH30518 [Nymphaea thermarum]|nr:hypothetical protein EJ110_NYTH30518 [Nymphaea thermarum]